MTTQRWEKGGQRGSHLQMPVSEISTGPGLACPGPDIHAASNSCTDDSRHASNLRVPGVMWFLLGYHYSILKATSANRSCSDRSLDCHGLLSPQSRDRGEAAPHPDFFPRPPKGCRVGSESSCPLDQTPPTGALERKTTLSKTLHGGFVQNKGAVTQCLAPV